jgi:hypothetical protein
VQTNEQILPTYGQYYVDIDTQLGHRCIGIKFGCKNTKNVRNGKAPTEKKISIVKFPISRYCRIRAAGVSLHRD